MAIQVADTEARGPDFLFVGSSFSPSISVGSELLSLVTGLAAPIHNFIYLWLCSILVAAGANL